MLLLDMTMVAFCEVTDDVVIVNLDFVVAAAMLEEVLNDVGFVTVPA